MSMEEETLISLSADITKHLALLADSQGITQAEALRKAIATEVYIQKEINAGSKILIQKSNKEIREMIYC